MESKTTYETNVLEELEASRKRFAQEKGWYIPELHDKYLEYGIL